MKRKGFTLVELLAVIVILAVIAIITIPIIGNVIEDSRKKALETSVYGLVEAAEYYAIYNNEAHVVFGEKATQNPKEILEYSGEIEAEGDLYIDNDGNISLCLENEDYYVYKNYNSGIYIGEMTGHGCVADYDPLTNKYIAKLDDGSGTVSNVYTIEEVDEKISEITSSLENTNTNVEAVNSQANQNKTDIANLQNSLGNYALRSELDETNGTIDSLSNSIIANTNNIIDLQNSVNDLNSNLNALEESSRNLGSWDSISGTASNSYTSFHLRKLFSTDTFDLYSIAFNLSLIGSGTFSFTKNIGLVSDKSSFAFVGEPSVHNYNSTSRITFSSTVGVSLDTSGNFLVSGCTNNTDTNGARVAYRGLLFFVK